jgi:hypothetical protein
MTGPLPGGAIVTIPFDASSSRLNQRDTPTEERHEPRPARARHLADP